MITRVGLCFLMLCACTLPSSASTTGVGAVLGQALKAFCSEKIDWATPLYKRPSGLGFAVLHHGAGRRLPSGTVAIVYYSGVLTNGHVFDSSCKSREPFTFALDKHEVIKGFNEGMSLTHVGDEILIRMPPNLAYGHKGVKGVIPPNATLLERVLLVDYIPE